MLFEVKNLNTSINKKQILSNIDFTLNSGEICIAIGPNGAGKSTLLKSIAKIIPTTGYITLDNSNLHELSIIELSQTVSLMTQFNSNTNLSVQEVLNLGRRPYSGFTLTKDDFDIITNIIDEFHLKEFLKRDIDTLSGGERQKVFLAAALIRNPKVLLLDEPISHLDPKNQQEILEIVKRVTIQRDIITIIVLHDLQNALHYGDKLLLLKNGKLQKHLGIDELKDDHLEELYDIKCKIFKNEGHPFVLLGHHHSSISNQYHNH
ncbi:MAG: ABC transporter ATP-binding protein [Arcobacteraceae bacterium]|nr:ABC transporter ATP-binding protein [Arcobacteraceae bacterium]